MAKPSLLCRSTRHHYGLSSPSTFSRLPSSFFSSTHPPKLPSRTGLPADYPTDLNYPTAADTAFPSSPPTNSFLLDQGYIKRYRDPARHDAYIIANHQDPYEFRTRPTVTQPLPARTNAQATHPKQASPDQSKELPLGGAPLRIGMCFPGSSSQYIGMGSFLRGSKAFEETWEEAEQALVEFERWRGSLDLVDQFRAIGYRAEQASLLGGPMRKGALLSAQGEAGLKEVVFGGPQSELTRSSNAQPAILITSMAYIRALEAGCRTPIRTLATVYAGHSSGEYTACVAAGTLEFRAGVHLTRLHGLLTTRALELHGIAPSTAVGAPAEQRAQMSALLVNAPAYSVADVAKVVGALHDEGVQVEIGSVNSSVQVVLSGIRAGVLAACERLQELEIANRAADLPCASPFHSSFMRPAAEGMKIALESMKLAAPSQPILISSSPSSPSSTDFLRPQIRLISQPGDLEVLKTHLCASVARPVFWSDTVHHMAEGRGAVGGVDRLVFVGPGRALRNLYMKEVGSGEVERKGTVEVGSLATEEDMGRCKEELEWRGGRG